MNMNKFSIKKVNAQTEIYNNREFYILNTCAGTVKANRGELKEYSLRIALTGEQPYYKDSSNHNSDSDIKVGNKNISVKSGEAGLGFMITDNLENYIDEYLEKDYSNTYMYVTESYEVYEMNKTEMREFLLANARISKTRNRRTNEIKLECRLKRDTTICKWLENI